MAKDSESGRADARRNRARLLKAAREVLKERGFEAEIGEIAARAGVGSGTIYRNFATKEALVLEVVREMASESGTQLLAIAANVSDVRECLRQAVEVGFRQVKRFGKLATQVVAGSAPEPYASSMRHHEALRHVFSLLIRRGIEQGHFREDLDIDSAVAFWFALVAPSAIGELLKIRTIDEITDLTSEFLLAGFS